MDFLASSACIFSTSFFFACALYINLVEHPARMAAGQEVAITQWPGSYRRAALLQVSMAISSIISATALWCIRNQIIWLVVAALMLSIIIYTLVVMFPTNKLLLRKDIDKSAASTKALLDKWIEYHSVRTALSFLAYLIALYYR